MKLRLLPIIAILGALSCLSCERRDPEAEFQVLSSTGFEPQEGMEKTREYLAHFRRNKKAHIQEVTALYREYVKIVDFDRKSYPDYARLVSEGKELNGELSKSPFQGIKDIWPDFYSEKQQQGKEYFLNLLTESDFSPKLAEAATELCRDKYKILWKSVETTEMQICHPILTPDGSAIQCAGEYSVVLDPLLGKDKIARVMASGRYSFDAQGNLRYTPIDSRIIEGPPISSETGEKAVKIVLNLASYAAMIFL